MQVKIGPQFFANELRVYRNWAERFFGEWIQNSHDAGSTKIDFTIGSSIDGVTEVTVTDNGHGMDRATLENVYFTLGETTKTSGNSVGGFGKARILTCFAQKSYCLRTQNLDVIGEGADYTIAESTQFFDGVDAKVMVFDKGINLVEVLQNYLKKCHLTAQVTINGEKWKDWTYKNKFERELSFARVYTNKSKTAGVLIRVGGVYMFSSYTSAPFLVIIEIDQEKSREVLQASRDGLLVRYHSELESFVAELNINKQSALKAKRSKSIKYTGTGTFTSNRSKDKSPEQKLAAFESLCAHNNCVLPEPVREAFLKNPDKMTERLHASFAKEGIVLNYPETPIAQGQLHSSGYETEHDEVELELELFNIIVEDETTNPQVRKVIESWYPQKWDLLGKVGERFDKRYGGYKSFRAGFDKYKLLILWKAACEYAIRLLQDELQIGNSSIPWGVGWIFNDPSEITRSDAAHKLEDGIHWLMLNPTKANGNMRLSMSSKRDLVKIISTAAHEVAHIVIGDHDERFANLLNELLEECMFHQGDILNYMKAAKEEAVARLEGMAKGSDNVYNTRIIPR